MPRYYWVVATGGPQDELVGPFASLQKAKDETVDGETARSFWALRTHEPPKARAQVQMLRADPRSYVLEEQPAGPFYRPKRDREPLWEWYWRDWHWLWFVGAAVLMRAIAYAVKVVLENS